MKKTNVVARVINRPTTTGGTRIMIITAIMAVLGLVLEIVSPELLDTTILVVIETLLGILFTWGASKSRTENENQIAQFAGTVHPPGDRPPKGG